MHSTLVGHIAGTDQSEVIDSGGAEDSFRLVVVEGCCSRVDIPPFGAGLGVHSWLACGPHTDTPPARRSSPAAEEPPDTSPTNLLSLSRGQSVRWVGRCCGSSDYLRSCFRLGAPPPALPKGP